MKKYLISYLTFILFISCNTSNKDVFNNEISNKKININKKAYAIKIDSTHLNSYSISNTSIINDSNYLIGYNPTKHSLDLFNLDTKTFSKSIELQKEGINKISTSVRSIFIQNIDSIFVLQEYKLSLIDTSAIIRKNISINIANTKNDFNLFQLFGDNGFDIYFKSNIIYVNKYSMKYNKNETECYNVNVETGIDLNTENTLDIPISFPDAYKHKKHFFGFLNQPSRTIHLSKHIYSFPAEPNIYIYDIVNKKTIVKNGKSKYQHNDIYKLSRNEESTEKLMRHFQSSPFYGKIIYDKYRDLYYRFFNWELEPQNTDGSHNSFGDKGHSIIIFDNEFKIIDEIELPKHTYSDSESFVSKEGLYLSTAHYKNPNTSEDSLRFDIYKFEVYE